MPHDHLHPDEILPDDYAAIHGPTVGDRVRLGDTGLVIEIEYDSQERGDEFLAGFAKTARDGLLLKAAAVSETCDVVISNVVVIDATRRIGKVSIGIREGRISGDRARRKPRHAGRRRRRGRHRHHRSSPAKG